MQTYHFNEVVDNKGAITLSGLPPLTKVVVVAIVPEGSDWQNRMERFIDKVADNHPLSQLSREEILQNLHQTREDVCEELYGDRYVD